MSHKTPEPGLGQVKLETTHDRAHMPDIDEIDANPGKRFCLSFRVPFGENLRVIVRTYGLELVREGLATTVEVLFELGVHGCEG